LGDLCDPRQLLVIRDSIPSSPVPSGFEFQQTQIFALFPMPVGFFSSVRAKQDMFLRRPFVELLQFGIRRCSRQYVAARILIGG
jgi:hypothetical protein